MAATVTTARFMRQTNGVRNTNPFLRYCCCCHATYKSSSDLVPRVVAKKLPFSTFHGKRFYSVTNTKSKSSALHTQFSNISSCDPLQKLHERTNGILGQLKTNANNDQSTAKINANAILKLLAEWKSTLKRLERQTGMNHHSGIVLMESVELVQELVAFLLKNSALSAVHVDAIETGIGAWARVSSFQSHAALHAQALFDQLSRAETINTNNKKNPSNQYRRQKLFHHLLHAWRHSCHAKATELCERIVQQMQVEGLVDRKAYNNLITVNAYQGNIGRIHELWQELTKQNLGPDKFSYFWYICALHKRFFKLDGNSLHVHQAVALYWKLLDAYAKTPIVAMRPDARTLQRVLSLCQHDVGQVYQVLDRSLAFETTFPECRDTLVTKFVLECVMHDMTGNDRVEDAETVLNWTLLNEDLKVNEKLFGIVMNGYAQRNTREATDKIEVLLTTLELRGLAFLNRNHYNIVMKGYLKSRPNDAVELMQATLDRMTKFAKANQKPDIFPCDVSYTTLMLALVRQGRPRFAINVQELLETIRCMFPTNNLTIPSNVAMDAWNRSDEPDKLDRVQAIFDSILVPDKISYCALLYVYARHGRADESIHLLHQMRGNHGVKPDRIVYNTALHSLCNSTDSGGWSKANVVLEMMLQEVASGNHDCQPTSSTIGPLFDILAKDKDVVFKHVEVSNLLQCLDQYDVHMDSRVLISACRACQQDCSDSSTNSKRATVTALAEAFGRLDSSARTPETYKHMVKACASLLNVDSEQARLVLGEYVKQGAHADKDANLTPRCSDLCSSKSPRELQRIPFARRQNGISPTKENQERQRPWPLLQTYLRPIDATVDRPVN
jgi:pentatricopeptide repeat protein